MKRSNRAAIAQSTLEIVKRGSYALPNGKTVDLAPHVEQCVSQTRYYSPDELSRLRDDILATAKPYSSMSLDVQNETTIQGIVRLSANADKPLGVLNFASAKNAGGGFLGGSQAQEESLARSSALFASLSSPAAAEYYDAHRRSRSCLYSDRMVLSPGCPVFRDDEGELFEQPHVVTFITSAAPNIGGIMQNQTDERSFVPATFRVRAELVLALAAQRGCAKLILGAWGCGVFRNDPMMVAQVFADLLFEGRPWNKRFAQVLFSVLDATTEKSTYVAFCKAILNSHPNR